MARRSRKSKVQVRTVLEQVLDEDYWEGFYALSESSIALFEDTDGSTAKVSEYSLSDGRMAGSKDVPYRLGDRFCNLVEGSSDLCAGGLFVRISGTVETPDRHSEIASALASGDIFDLMRIRSLIRRIRDQGILVMGGVIGSRMLYEAGYEGFYLLEDGRILYCRDRDEWNSSDVDGIIDGVVSYRIIDPRRFSLSESGEHLFGYLRGERFSVFAETLMKDHGRIVSELGVCPGDDFDLFSGALSGDKESISLARHRFGLDIRH